MIGVGGQLISPSPDPALPHAVRHRSASPRDGRRRRQGLLPRYRGHGESAARNPWHRANLALISSSARTGSRRLPTGSASSRVSCKSALAACPSKRILSPLTCFTPAGTSFAVVLGAREKLASVLGSPHRSPPQIRFQGDAGELSGSQAETTAEALVCRLTCSASSLSALRTTGITACLVSGSSSPFCHSYHLSSQSWTRA